jgi:hypothetical protein
MPRIELKITGLDRFADKLRNAAKELNNAIGREMYLFAEEVMSASKMVVPVKTGTLMNTGHVELPVIEGRSVTVRMGYGGPAAPYALYVHEALEGAVPPSPSWSWTKKVAAGGTIAWTRPGSGPKYLENPLKERQDQLPDRVKSAVLAVLKDA